MIWLVVEEATQLKRQAPTDSGGTTATDSTREAAKGSCVTYGYTQNRSETSDLHSDILMRLLRCQNAVLGHITRKSPTDETFSPIFSTVIEQMGPCACGIEVRSPRSNLIYHLSHQGLPNEILKAGAHRLIEDAGSLGAVCIAAAQTVLRPNLHLAAAPLPDDLRDRLLHAGISAVWSLPVPDDEGTVLASLTFYFDHPFKPGPGDWQVAEFMADLASHAVVHRLSRQAKKVADSHFAMLADAIPGVVYQRAVTPDGQIRYTYISDSAEDLFGVPAREILEDPNALFDCHGEGYREDFRERLLEASRTLEIWDVEATIVSRDGRTKCTHAIAKPFKQVDGTVVWNGVILDATRIKEAEKAAAAAEARTRQAIVESINQGFVLFDAEDKLVIANRRFLSYYPQLGAILTPGMTLARFRDAERTCGIISHDAENLDEQLRCSHVEERQVPDGSWLLVQTHKAEGGETAILYTDVSELKERETLLARSNRELQDFASVASHDLQEPLRKIEAFGDRLSRRCAEHLDETGQMYLERMQSASGRMRQLINDLLTYSRVTTKGRPFAPCDLTQVLRDVLSDLQLRIEETGARIEAPSLPTIDADSVQMRQLFQNVIGNALKYRKEGVPPLVEITVSVLERGARPSCEIRIADNGIGFEMRYADRIFNIFQRLHSIQEFEGTGIGLATCRKIVERHGGSLSVDSVVGDGSTFTISLPIVQAAEATNHGKTEDAAE